jgi:co-chaperonin GroES (HSP10)
LPYMVMTHDVEPAEALKKELGDISKVEIFNNQVLVAVYIRPGKTKSGIYLSDKTTDEDRFQSKVGLLVKMGDAAFADDGAWFANTKFNIGDWLVSKPSDGWSITINGVLCRILDDINVRGRVDTPDRAW